jgi:hypothetical protein
MTTLEKVSEIHFRLRSLGSWLMVSSSHDAFTSSVSDGLEIAHCRARRSERSRARSESPGGWWWVSAEARVPRPSGRSNGSWIGCDGEGETHEVNAIAVLWLAT